MTLIELKAALLNRIGFRQETGVGFTVNADNLESQSQRFYQDDHKFVTLHKIVDYADPALVTDEEFNAFLTDLRESVVMGTITDVIETSEVPEGFLLNRENLFDSAIIKKMAIQVGEVMLTSTRSNLNERVGKEFLQRLFFELNGNSGNPAMPNFYGLRTRYEQEIERIKSLLGHQKALSVTTYRTNDYLDDDLIKFL